MKFNNVKKLLQSGLKKVCDKKWPLLKTTFGMILMQTVLGVQMVQAIRFFSILFILLSFNAHAKKPLIKRYLGSLSIYGTSLPGSGVVCPEEPKPLTAKSAEELRARGDSAFEKKKYCDAAQAYYEIQRLFPDWAGAKDAWIKLIEAYYMAENYDLAINEANTYMDIHRATARATEAHFWVIKSVNIQVEDNDADYAQEWVRYALKMHPEQQKENRYLLNLVYDSFIEQHPDDPRVEEVKKMKAVAIDMVCKNFLMVGQFYLKQKDYKAALGRFSFPLRYGPGTVAFHEAYYETIRALTLFAQALADPKQVDDKRFTELTEGQMPENRQKIAEQTRLQAVSLAEKQKSNFPENEWTLKTQEFLQKEASKAQK